MTVTDTIVLSLLGAAVVTSIIELGISAYFSSVSYNVRVPDYNYYTGYTTYDYIHVRTPGQFSYLVFDSIWSLLVSIFLIVTGFFLPKRFHNVSDKVLGGVTLVLTVLTMLHWLAGFAALAAYYSGFTLGGIWGALMAFAVIPWLIYLALTVLTFLTAFGVLKSERRGRSHIFGRSSGSHQPGPTNVAPMQQQHTQQPQFQHQPEFPLPNPVQPQHHQTQESPYKNEQTVQRVDAV